MISATIPGDSFLNFPSCTKTALRCTNVDQKLKNITLASILALLPAWHEICISGKRSNFCLIQEPFKSDTTELVDLAVIFPDLEIELKYACADNITGKAIYQQARCLLHKDAITALAKSISIAQLSGLQLVIYDAYRPQQAQAMLWQACPDPQYVVDVTVGSNHSRGTAIDLTLRDEHGNILDMGAGFDEMHERSHAYHPSVPPAAQRNRLLLNAIMTGGGFVGISSEWWHFELPQAASYPLLADQFSCFISPGTQHVS